MFILTSQVSVHPYDEVSVHPHTVRSPSIPTCSYFLPSSHRQFSIYPFMAWSPSILRRLRLRPSSQGHVSIHTVMVRSPSNVIWSGVSIIANSCFHSPTARSSSSSHSQVPANSHVVIGIRPSSLVSVHRYKVSSMYPYMFRSPSILTWSGLCPSSHS